MKLVVCFITSLAMTTGALWAGGAFAGNDCVHCGAEGLANKEEVSKEDVLLICQTARSGMFSAGRIFGKEVYGSLEEYYNRFDRIDCSSYYANPIILGLEQNIMEYELVTELEKIEEHMDEEMIDYLINMPTREGRYSRTLMDMAQKHYEVAVKGDNKPAIPILKRVLNRLENLGAKRLKELSPSQKSRYPYLNEY